MTQQLLNISREILEAINCGSVLENMEDHKYQLIINDFKSFFESKLGHKVTLYMLGSRLLGLATNESYLDIFVCIDHSHYYNGLTDLDKQTYSAKSIEIQLMEDDKWTVHKSPFNTLLLAIHRSTGIRCNFSFTNGFTHANSFFIKYLLDMQKESRKLIFFLKIWLKNCNVHMNGYLLTILVIFYMQQKNFLPSVQTIQMNCSPCKVATRNSAYKINRSLSDYGPYTIMSNYLHHAVDFCAFYAMFDFNEKFICPYFGISIAKNVYSEEMANIGMEIGSSPQNWILSDKIIILEPLNCAWNLSNLMQAKDGFQFISCCLSTSKMGSMMELNKKPENDHFQDLLGEEIIVLSK